MVKKNKRVGNEQYHSSTFYFFSNIIDYAGLFPPAQLSLEEAIRNYIAYQRDNDAWMLGHFIIPVTRLDELTPYVSFFSEKNPLNISAIGQRSLDAESCIDLLTSDMKRIAVFLKKHRKAVNVKVFEMPLPPAVPNRRLLDEISQKTQKYNLQTFCEVTVPFNDKWKQQMLLTLNEIAIHNNNNDSRLGLKLRTGGVTADAFPTPEQVAIVLHGCCERSIPQKFTAGLHHPIRLYREEVKTKMHGFLNVFTAGMLARTRDLDRSTISEILADEDASNFTFTDEGIAWKNMVVSVAELQHLRRNALSSYGSCSFDEPREDLRVLNIIE
ncbi:hypothetical protein BTR23_12700 [Alkalihalophilus pseudofirmus]|nr:hypothetical protein BTR23_12700 [Alkalihalophilus pseudofirmus]